MLKRQDDRRSPGLGPPGAVNELLKLYNLSLAIRGVGDPYKACVEFLSETVRHLQLSYGAVWLIEPGEGLESGDFVLFASYPRARDGLDRVNSDHPMPKKIAQGEPIRVDNAQEDFLAIAVEPSIKSGVQVIYRLDGVGLLKLYCSDPAALARTEINRLGRVVDRFADSLRGIFATRRLRQEINQRVIAEDKLDQARMLSQTLWQFSPDLIFYKDLEGRYVEGNQAFRDFWNLGDRQIMGMRPEEVIPPEILPVIAKQDKLVIESRKARFFQEAITTVRGERVVMEVTRAPVYDSAGRTIGIIGIARDATDRLTTLSKLQTRNRALESMTDGVFITTTDDNMTVVYVNKAFSVMAGVSREQLVGRPTRDIGMVKLDEVTRSQVRNAIKHHQPYFLSIEQRRPNGDHLTFEITLAPVLDDSGRSSHYVTIVKDVTERERLRRELQQRQKMDTVGRLTSGIAHDFNNMLATILGFSELAEMRAEQSGDNQLQDFLDSIRSAATNGRELVSQLMTFSRSVPNAKPQVIKANETLAMALKMVEPLLHKGVEFGYTCSAPDTLLAMDVVSLERLVMNLCLNGRDAMSGGGVLAVELKIDNLSGRVCAISMTQLEGEYVCIVVSDTGSGIPEDLRGRIFEPFFTTKRPSQGTGMGLSVVQGIAKAHSGNILIETTMGVGTSVIAAFPVTLQQASSFQRLAAPERPSGSLEGRSILVVDDDRQVATFLRELFVHAGMTVQTAYDGNSGLEKFSQAPQMFDVVITDQTMPGMSGVDLVRQIRKLRPEIPCIMLTAYSHFADSSSASAAGIDRLLRKPTDNKTLLQSVAELI